MRLLAPLLIAIVLHVSGACSAQALRGSGATFPAPLYARWISVYREAHPQLQMEYQAVGSGQGIENYRTGASDFFATDVPIDKEQVRKLPHPITQLPTVGGGIAIVYNLPGLTTSLRLSPATLADIFLGKITRWDDDAIKVDNPEARLPPLKVVVVHRSDGSGTVKVFTEYLSAVSPEWKERVGSGKTVNWPVGVGGFSVGVGNLVRTQRGAIGFIELTYAQQNRVITAALKNRAGRFITPSLASCSAALAALKPVLSANPLTAAVNAPGADSYPICSLTYLAIPTEAPKSDRWREFVSFLRWCFGPGQKYASDLNYVSLPDYLVRRNQALLARTATNQPRVTDRAPRPAP